MKTEKVHVIPATWGEEHRDVVSVCIPVPNIVTALVANKAQFVDVFEDEREYEMILQGLNAEVREEYKEYNTFPTTALVPYKSEGEVIFYFNHLERDEFGEKLFVYYDYESTIS